MSAGNPTQQLTAMLKFGPIERPRDAGNVRGQTDWLGVDSPMIVQASESQRALTAFSEWLDESNYHRGPEAVDWGRIGKIAEELGEVHAAFIGWTGQNPRKGTTRTRVDVIRELLDIAVTALAAVEHFTEHRGDVMELLDHHIATVTERAGVTL